MRRTEPRKEQWITFFANLAEFVWRTIYDTKAPDLGYDDFVSSLLIGGRALYCTNFRPFEVDEMEGDPGFTRTFVVDFNLTSYQRGRLVRRLCEIATYRMSCIRDIERIRAIQDGINHLNRDFSDVIGTLDGLTAKQQSIDRSTYTLEHWNLTCF